MRLPPIKVACECGETKELRYGERWKCERCGRVWDTSQIPAEEYHGMMRGIRRARLEPVGLALVLLAVLVPLALIINPGLLLVIPLLLGGLAIFYGPIWKKRMRRRIAERPRWELHPE